MVEVILLIPVADNDGRAFDPTHDDVFRDHAARQFSGCTVLPALVAGVWLADGVTYHDQSRVFLVRVDGLVKNGAALLGLVEYAKAHYRQLAVYVRYLGVSEIL